jgi:disulfide bond formation protein DsbB
MNVTFLHTKQAYIVFLLIVLVFSFGSVPIQKPILVKGNSELKNDFNGDGYSDLAIGVPKEDIGTSNSAGAVNILYGTTSGLSSTGNQMWHQNSPGILGICESDDNFGAALAVGDFDGDDYDDLAVGVEGESIGTHSNAGAVNILYGTTSGLSSTGNQMWHQNSPGIPGVSQDWDGFGSSMAAGDFNGDGYDDLAIGVPGEDVGSVPGAGGVHLLYGSSSGLSAWGCLFWHQNSPGVYGICEDWENYGSTLAVGDLNGDGYADLIVGVKDESFGTIDYAGAVNVFYGSSSGLSASGNQFWHQNSPGILDKCEATDQFGSALTVGDFNGDNYDDLAVGTDNEWIGTIMHVGSVNIIYGSSSGLSSTGNQFWHQNRPGILEKNEECDHLAWALTVGDFNGDNYDDLGIGVVGETIGVHRIRSGAVNVMYGSSSGLSSAGDQLWHQNSPGILGINEWDDSFGQALSSGDFDGDGFDELAVGNSWESIGLSTYAGVVNLLYGSSTGLSSTGNQLWHQNRPGVLGICEKDDEFGSVIA